MNDSRPLSKWGQWREELRDFFGEAVAIRAVLTALAVYLVAALALGIYWSDEPELFAVREQAARQVAAGGNQLAPGSVTTATLIQVMATLLDKPGGFLANDILPPGVWLDNGPAWEYGAIIQVRDMARAMRESFSRSQSQSEEDDDLGRAEPRLNFSVNSWAVPASESEYRDALTYLRSYLARLGDDRAHFYARSDNLRYWLGSVETRLGNLSQRLGASVGPRRAADAQATAGGRDGVVRTPWRKLDDVFYESRGSTWALIHFLRAVEIDFADVLRNKNAEVSLRRIISELEASQEPLYSPLILNGTGFGMLANHSLVMASYVSRAHAAIIDLRDLLSQG
jgi:hypothetical protein